MSGRTGAGRAVPLTADTGDFWFFGAENVEVVLKVLDGRPVTSATGCSTAPSRTSSTTSP